MLALHDHPIVIPVQVEPRACAQFGRDKRQIDPVRQPVPRRDQPDRTAYFVGLWRRVKEGIDEIRFGFKSMVN
jgi:hypothetical protein